MLASFTYMLALSAHLYMPHLFTHWLPTIICVMLMSIAFFYLLFLLYATLFCDSILACLCTYFLFLLYFCVILRFFFFFLIGLPMCFWYLDCTIVFLFSNWRNFIFSTPFVSSAYWHCHPHVEIFWLDGYQFWEFCITQMSCAKV